MSDSTEMLAPGALEAHAANGQRSSGAGDERHPSWWTRTRARLRLRAYGTLEDAHERTTRMPTDVRVVGSKLAATACLAFRDMQASLARVERATSLQVDLDRAAILCYLCSIRTIDRKPLTDRQYEAFCDYIYKRYTTYVWLGAWRAVPSFFFPVLFPIITTALILFYDGMSDTVNVILSAIFAVVGTIGGQLAGWVITGTQPNASSEAANEAQNMLLDLSDDYASYAYYLLDLYCNESPALRTFACEVAASLDADLLEAVFFALIPRPDAAEAEDGILTRARFQRVVKPLKEVVAYIQSEGCIPPTDEILRGRIDAANTREQVSTLLQRLHLLSTLVSSLRPDKESLM